jgi:hypothetical protein
MKKILLLSFAALLLAGGCGEVEEGSETPPYAASKLTRTFGDLIWSDAIWIPECNKPDFEESDFYYPVQDCRSFTPSNSSKAWYYYNWYYVSANKDRMCPSPWRVPSREDLESLQSATSPRELSQVWGLSGRANGSAMEDVNELSYYWSSTANGSANAYDLYYYNGGTLGVGSSYRYYGYQVRCVRESKSPS